MLDTAWHDLLIGARDAIGVWAALITLAALAIAVVLAPAWREHALRTRVRAGSAQLRRARRDAQRRCAQEISAAAAGAAVTAQRRHAAWVVAQTAAENAWEAFDPADTVARRAVQAVAFATTGAGPTLAELAERQAVLHGAATDAHRRGELSSRQLADILAGRNGFEPSRHPAELDVRLRLAIRGHLLHTYEQASAAERVAWREADVAAAARSSLAVEAIAAAAQTQHPQRPVAVRIPRQRTGTSTGSGWWPHPATR